METENSPLDNLLQNLHKDLDKLCPSDRRYAMHVTLSNYAMDAARPVGGGESEIIKHIQQRTAPGCAFSTNRRVAALGLRYSCAKGKIILRNKDGDAAYFANDAENSGLLLLDVAAARALEKLSKIPVASTYNLFMRITGINARKPYKNVAGNQHTEYVRRTQFQATHFEVNMSVNDMFDTLGNPKEDILDRNTVVLTDVLPVSCAPQLFAQCEKGKASLKFNVHTAHEARQLLANYAEVLLYEGTTLLYTPLDCHPAYPLVSGPECPLALAKIETLIDQWLKDHKLDYNLDYLDPTVQSIEPASPRENAPVLADIIKQSTIHESGVPKEIMALFSNAMSMPQNRIRAFLIENKITADNADIWTMDGSNHLPSQVTKACKQSIAPLVNPNARAIMSRVHWALTNRELYTKKDVHRLPKEPWLAVIYLLCRHRETFGIKDYVYVESIGDWAHPNGEAVHSLKTDWSAAVEQEQRSKPFLQSRAGPSPSDVKTEAARFSSLKISSEDSRAPAEAGRGRSRQNRSRGGRGRGRSQSRARPRSKSVPAQERGVTFENRVQRIEYTDQPRGPTVPRGRGNGRGRGRGRAARNRASPVDIAQLAQAINENTRVLSQSLMGAAGAAASPANNC